MKKILIILCLLVSFISCSHEADMNDSVVQYKTEQFKNDFNGMFQVSPKDYADHSWGMNTIPLVDVTNKVVYPAKTRSANVNGNLWHQTYERPVNITQEEINWAKGEFGKVREGATHTQQITWENYWVQQVYTGQNYSVDGNGTKVYPSTVMNQFIAWRYNTKVISWWPYEWAYESTGEYEHVNNFNNAANNTVYTDDETHEQFIGTTLMENMKSDGRNDQFGYHNTSDASYHYDYIILEHNGAYYIGFDIVGYHPVGQDQNANMDVDRDWIFDDWIIKISPAKLVQKHDEVERVRIMCEDLGTDNSDFDYNDVVFDIKFIKDGSTYYADIILRAAGGTLPLKIGPYEVHDLFNVNSDVMVNTGAGPKKDSVPFEVTLPKSNYSNAWDAINDLPVYVLYDGNIPIQLTTSPGAPAEMIAVPVSTAWSPERVSIRNSYPKFVEWIKDSSVKWYE